MSNRRWVLKKASSLAGETGRFRFSWSAAPCRRFELLKALTRQRTPKVLVHELQVQDLLQDCAEEAAGAV